MKTRGQKSEVRGQLRESALTSDLRPLTSSSRSSRRESISCLARQIRALSTQLELDWLKAHAEFATKKGLLKLEKIMAKTNAELIAQSQEQLATIKKVEAETAALIELVRVLTEAANNQQNPSEELTAASQAVTDELKTHDDQVTDES